MAYNKSLLMKKNLKVSIIIPVYNDGESLLVCLRTIEELSVKPFEVIVVDNNSNDQTRDIASSFSFVRLISESKQGVVHARSSGFDAARGDIFARIDADTLLYDGWIDQIVSLFNNNPELAAVSGPPDYYDIKLTKTANQIDHQIRKFLAKHLSKHLLCGERSTGTTGWSCFTIRRYGTLRNKSLKATTTMTENICSLILTCNRL